MFRKLYCTAKINEIKVYNKLFVHFIIEIPVKKHFFQIINTTWLNTIFITIITDQIFWRRSITRFKYRIDFLFHSDSYLLLTMELSPGRKQ